MYIPIFFNSALVGMSGQFYISAALPPTKESSVHFG
jgi:hypothetical protein